MKFLAHVFGILRRLNSTMLIVSAGLARRLPAALSIVLFCALISGCMESTQKTGTSADSGATASITLDTSKSSVRTANPSVPADGNSAATITVILVGRTSQLLAGKSVALTSSRDAQDTITPAVATTNANGIAVFRVKSIHAGFSSFTATDLSTATDLALTTSVNFMPLAFSATVATVAASTSIGVANGIPIAVTVTLTDINSNSISDRTVTLTSDRAGSDTITAPSGAISDQNGQVVFNVTSSAVGNSVYTATTGTVALTHRATVNYIAGISGIANTSTNEDTAKSISFTIAAIDNTLALSCSTANLSMTSSNPAVVLSARVVWSGTAPNCTAVVTPVANAFGVTTLTFRVSDGTLVASSAFTLTVNRLADDPLSPANIPFDALTTGSYISSDWNKMDFTGGVCRLKPSDQLDDDNSANGFGGGSAIGVIYGTLADGSSQGLTLDPTGIPTNHAELDSSWAPQWSSIVGYWKMNLNWNDSKGGHTGTSSASAFNTASKLGSHAGLFNGGTVAIADHADFNFGSTFSAALWVNGASQDNRIAFSQYDNGNNERAWFIGTGRASDGIAGDKLQMTVSNSGTSGVGTYMTYASSISVFTSTWTHVAITFNSGVLKFYINGIEDTHVVKLADPGGITIVHDSTASVLFGSHLTNGVPQVAGLYTGKIDDAALWSTVLLPGEINTLYSRQSARFAGTFTSRVMDAWGTSSWTQLSWVPTLPYFKELPDYTGGAIQNESSSNYSSLVGSSGSTGANDLMSGIVGLWHMNEALWADVANEVKDDSGHGNHGRAQGGATTTSNGKLLNAGNFDGVNDNVNIIGTASSLDLTGAFTVSAWVNTFDNTNSFQNIIAKDDGGTNSGVNYQLRFSHSSTKNAQFRASRIVGGDTYVTGTSVLQNNTWYLLTGVNDGTDFMIYVNGVLESTRPSGGAMTTTLSPCTIGAGVEGSNYFFKGRIDEAAIWSRGLKPAEVKQLYLRGASRLKYQVRTCAAADPTCAAATWQGPNGTNQTYFSELNNNTVALTAAGDVRKTLPSLTLSDFTSPPSDNRFFQYRTIFETDDATIANGPELKSVTVDPIHYDATRPWIYNNTGIGIDFFTLSSFTETLGVGSCTGAKYQLSSDNATWWWYTGGVWTQTTVGDYSETNSAAQLTGAAMAAFPVAAGAGLLQVKTFLNSSGTTACEIDLLSIGGAR